MDFTRILLLTVAGLSVARVDHVSGDTVIFRGADVVDGTPVLDIKPYIPYVDGGVGAQAPAWVSVLGVRVKLNHADICNDWSVRNCFGQCTGWQYGLLLSCSTTYC